jgi:hypothetical protein
MFGTDINSLIAMCVWDEGGRRGGDKKTHKGLIPK